MIWGKGEFGLIKTPQKLFMDKTEFVDCVVSKYDALAVAVDKSGKVFSWGKNNLGQLGHGDTRDRKLPTQILTLKKKMIQKVAVGHQFVIMLGPDIKVNQQTLQLPCTTAPTIENDTRPFDSQVFNEITSECHKKLLEDHI